MEQRRPLEGVRILDAFHWWAGPLSMYLLACMGAEVIKVESRQRYDGFRVLIIARQDDPNKHEWSAAYNACNHDKYCITLDLTNPKGVRYFKELAKISDVVTESLRPGLMQKMGLGYADIKAVKPDTIYVSHAGYGSTGPYANYVGYAAPFAQHAGGMWLQGYVGEVPLGGGASTYTDPTNGQHTAFAVLCALYYKKRTGKGQFIDFSQIESPAGLYANFFMEYALNGRIPGQQGNRHASAAPHNTYRAQGQDRWVAIAVTTDEEWLALCKVMGNPAWSQDKQFATAAGRYRHQEELDQRVNEWTKNYDHYELMHLLQQAGVPCGAVINEAEILSDPHFAERETFRVMDRKFNGPYPLPDFPYKLTKTPCPARWASPSLGEHNELIFKKYLGLTDKELQELEAEQVIGTTPVWVPVT